MEGVGVAHGQEEEWGEVEGGGKADHTSTGTIER